MKKSLIVYLSFPVLSALSVVGFSRLQPMDLSVKATAAVDTYGHYTSRAPTSTTPGSKEFWISCSTHEVLFAAPSLGTIIDRGQPLVSQIRTWKDDATGRYIPCAQEALEFTSYGDGTCKVSGIGTFNYRVLSFPTTSPSGDRVIEVDNSAIRGCDFLQEIVIPETVTTLGWYFGAYCDNLTTVSFPKSVTSIGSYILDQCPKLDYISINSSNPNYTAQGYCLIDKANKKLLKGTNRSIITTSSSVVTSIGYDAFAALESLTEITIPNNITSLAEGVFKFCSNLRTVNMPNTIPEFGYDLFRYDSNLSVINYVGTKAQWNAIKKETMAGMAWNAGVDELTVRCTDGSIVINS